MDAAASLAVTEPDAPPGETEGDDALVARARTGDRGAFSDLATRHREALFRAAFAVLGDADEALDATQEALVRAFRHLATFDGRASFKTWARKIATNRALDRLEARRRDPTRGRSLPEGDVVATAAATTVDELSRDEERVIVRRAIDELPPAQRAAVLLRDVEGLSYEEIALALGIPKGTVMSRIYYGRETLKETLGRLLGRDRLPERPTEGRP